MPTYTVVALLDLDTAPPEMLIAGVLAREHMMVDADPGTIGARFQRYATSVDAADPDAAERVARHEQEHANTAETSDIRGHPHPLPQTAGEGATNTDHRIEVVTYRDPDGPTSLYLFVDGRPAEPAGDWTDIDPGAGHVLDEWRQDRDAAVATASPAAAAVIRKLYGLGESSEHVTQRP